MSLKTNTKYILACALMLAAAFIQCYRTVHGLHWASEPDFDRDIAYIRATLNGHYGIDPNMAGQYMWYNPMIFFTEALVVKVTGLPINIVVARAGAFLNLINPIVFFIVVIKLFDYKTALAALLSFVFLINGNLPCWGAATYSPWMVSDTAVQFTFYLSIFFCYKAFKEEKLLWFVALGAMTGITFLGHSAPTILIIFILISMQGQRVLLALKHRQFARIGTYFLQGAATFIPFIIFAFPFLYYVYGIYHLHFINRTILQCAPGIFARKETFTLLKLNVTFSLIFAVIGFIWFYKNFHHAILRKIIWNWLVITLVMYAYESIVPTADKILHVDLPDTIPAFHYFFYFKALQSIFFAFGFIYLFDRFIKWFEKRGGKSFSSLKKENLFIGAVVLYALIYFPVYSNRWDFSSLREQAVAKGRETDKIAVYQFISDHIPLSNVMLCPHGLSLFPVMPSAIKMVSIETYFSNPYVSYDQREADRDKMLHFLTTSAPDTAKHMFKMYHVDNVLLTNEDYQHYHEPVFANSNVIFRNDSYTILSFHINKNK